MSPPSTRGVVLKLLISNPLTPLNTSGSSPVVCGSGPEEEDPVEELPVFLFHYCRRSIVMVVASLYGFSHTRTDLPTYFLPDILARIGN